MRALLAQRIFALVLGYENLNDHERLRTDPVFVELFLNSYRRPPAEIVLDLNATDVPLHGDQERRFFHGYYDHYCYLPLYVYCGRQPLLARLRPADIDGAAGAREAVEQLVGQIRARWPQTRIVLRADSGFAREALMGWCEAHRVDYLFGLARNQRLVRATGDRPRAARSGRRSAPHGSCSPSLP